MKHLLSPEQSATLIAKGISADKASEIKEYNDEVSQWTHRGAPIFTLADIFSILPKEIALEDGFAKLRIRVAKQSDAWNADYWTWIHPKKTVKTQYAFYSTELIDALYSLLCWVIDNGYINLPK